MLLQKIITNVPVFRRVYEELGMGWVYAVRKLPIIGKIADILYSIWAYWRLKFTGRPALAEIITSKNQNPDDNLARCRLEKSTRGGIGKDIENPANSYPFLINGLVSSWG